MSMSDVEKCENENVVYSHCYLSGWLTEYRCSNCENIVSFSVKMGSFGRCPKCGYKGSDARTIMDVTEHPYRLIRNGKWWHFWIRPIRQYK